MALVKVKNKGDTAVNFGDVVIDADTAVEVDYDLATGQLGDPNGDPVAELARIQTIWGFYPGFAPDDAWVPPALEVTDADGKRVWLIHDDPTGENAAAAAEPKKKSGK